MIKKIILSLIVGVSILGTMSVGASAEWKQDSCANWSWVEKGAQAKGWKQIDGNWYNFGDNGIMKTGWMEDNGNWYYFWSNGMMASNSWLWNGQLWYYLDENGKFVSTSVVVEDRQYNFEKPAFIYSQDLNGKTATYASVTINTTNTTGAAVTVDK